MTSQEEIKIIRKWIKSQPGLEKLHVKNGAGTAYGWVEISGSGIYGDFGPAERKILNQIGINCGGNFAVISPDDRRHYVAKAQH